MSKRLSMVSGDAYPLSPGRYQYVIDLASGTVTFAISQDNGVTFIDMVDGVFSADGDGTLWAGNGVQIRATISASAVVSLFKIQ